MFSVSTINKTLLLTLLFPTVINCSMILSEDTTVSARQSIIGGALVGGLGLMATAHKTGMFDGASLVTTATTSIHESLNGDNSNKNLAFIMGLGSLVGGYATYRYLNRYTPEGKLEQAKNILTKIENQIEKNKRLQEIIAKTTTKSGDDENSQTLQDLQENIIQSIVNNFPEKNNPEVHFLKTHIKPTIKEIKKAENLLNEYLKANTSKSETMKSSIAFPSVSASEIEENQSELIQTKLNTLFTKMSSISIAIKNRKNHQKDAQAYNQNKFYKNKTAVNKEKRQSLEDQNSSFKSFLNSLMQNPVCLNSLVQIILLFINRITG